MKKVYLDQNIYSNFARAEIGTKSRGQLYSFLLSLKESNEIICPFSLAHISETVGTPEKHTQDIILDSILKLSGNIEISQASGALVKSNLQEKFTALNSNPNEHKALQNPFLAPTDIIKKINSYGLNPGNLNNLEPETALERIDKILRTIPKEELFNDLTNYKAEAFKYFDVLENFINSENEKSIKSFKQNLQKSMLDNLPELEKILGEPLVESDIEFLKQISEEIVPHYENDLEKILKSQTEIFQKVKKDNIDKINQISPQNYDINSYTDIIEKSKKALMNVSIHEHFLYAIELTLLSTLGYFRDKKETEKQKLEPNFIEAWDPNHFLFATNCDFFISEDISFLKRGNLVIKRNKLSLRMLSSEQYINAFSHYA